MSEAIIKEIQQRMDQAIQSFKRSLATVRAGRANPAILNHVMVDYYGAPTPLNQLATITAPEARLIVVTPFDKSSIGEVEKAIQKADLGLAPSSDGNIVRIVIPALTEERRKELKEALIAAKRNYIDKTRVTKQVAHDMAVKVMEEVGIPNAARRFRQYPFEFSGGMRQRIVIAIALIQNPDILICDEPTTALDVTIQAQILELILRLKRERQLSVIFITHDLGVVANMADRVAVMYAGRIVEYGKVEEIFYNPKHPYTWALLSSIPDVDTKERLEAIPGTPPNMVYPPKGDAFAPRSKYAMAVDFIEEPPYFKVSETHYARTWLLDPRAPKVEMPKIVSERIRISLERAGKGGEFDA